MTPLVVNPANLTYLQRVPYLTAAEYEAAPTAVDTSQLVPGGDAAANLAALNAVIARASSWADQICFQVLAATTDTEVGVYRVRRDGYMILVAKRFPILEVDSISIGQVAGQMQAIDAADGANIWIQDRLIYVPIGQMSLPSLRVPVMGPGNRLLVTFTYVNGWPNTVLAAAASSSTVPTTFDVTSALGVYVGTQLEIYDGASTELVTVTAVSGNTLSVAGLAFAHASGVSVSALPPGVKQAAISLTSCLIKTRGTMAIAMATIDAEPTRTQRIDAGGNEDYEIACKLLVPYTRASI